MIRLEDSQLEYFSSLISFIEVFIPISILGFQMLCRCVPEHDVEGKERYKCSQPACSWQNLKIHKHNNSTVAIFSHKIVCSPKFHGIHKQRRFHMARSFSGCQEKYLLENIIDGWLLNKHKMALLLDSSNSLRVVSLFLA